MPLKKAVTAASKLMESIPVAVVTEVPKGRYERPVSLAPVVNTPPTTVVKVGVAQLPVKPRGTGTPA